MQWPQNSVILPGNEVIFSLETASDYLKADRASSYGFKCLVIGYEWPPEGSGNSTYGLRHLENELAFLGGMCAANLMKKDLLLPLVGGEFDNGYKMALGVNSILKKNNIFQMKRTLILKWLK